MPHGGATISQFMKLLTVLLALVANAIAADRPNILFIMTDDHAAHAMARAIDALDAVVTPRLQHHANQALVDDGGGTAALGDEDLGSCHRVFLQLAALRPLCPRRAATMRVFPAPV